MRAKITRYAITIAQCGSQHALFMSRQFQRLLHNTANAIDGVHRFIGQSLSWLGLVMAVLVTVIILARLFDIGSTALQESITYIHATIFMLCLGYAGISDAHVRVDICYRRYSPQTRAWVNLFGSMLFLLPFSVFLSFISLEAAIDSWKVREASINAGGLPFVYLLKSLAPLGGALLTSYAISDILKQLCAVSFVDGSDSETSKHNA
jgi:TRAP-type mannitol/chloroaromatic compound transport system permease small subunit